MNIMLVNLNDLCQPISVSIANIRFLFRSQAQIPEILDSFWRLQDNFGRLVDAASVRPFEVFEFLKREYPQLLRDIIDVLSTTLRKGLTRNIAVGSSCEAINELLMKLEALKPLSRSIAAGT